VPDVVYVVDDDPLVTESLGTALRLETGEDIRTFNRPEDALAVLPDAPPAVVISDFKMGPMDGLTLLRRVRDQVPDAVLMLLTGYADKEMAIAAINQVGIYQYIEKPWDLGDLLAKLRAALERRSLVRRLEQKSADLSRSLEELRLTQERLIETARLAAVGRVVSGIAHELGNQLALVGYAEAIRRRTEDPEVREFADVIVAAQRRLLAMVEEIRDFVRGQSSQLDAEPMALSTAVDDALAILRFDAEVKKRHVTRRPGPDASAAAVLVRGHRAKLAQVVINLVRNAVQASPDGGAVEVESGVDVEGAFLRVRDRGVGMPAEVLARIGEPFYSTKGDRGTGLGLVISRKIAEAHGGRLEIESQAGQGTVATLRLPAITSVTEPAPARAEGASA
jgi:signal transduction histidine kinase